MVKILAFALLFGLMAAPGYADDVPGLKAIEARYDLKKVDGDEALRQKYILELATLRWHLARHDLPGWEAVDAEIARHPAPPNSDAKALARALVGVWHSPRHDYLLRADGTWRMNDDPDDPDATQGTWSVHGNQYTETVDSQLTYTIILIDKDNFIFAQAGAPSLFYEKRSLKGGFPLRRDDPAP